MEKYTEIQDSNIYWKNKNTYPLDVSIILVNYNTTDLLINAIKSVIDKSSGFSYEIIVVDNNSPTNPSEQLKEEFGDTIIYLPLHENIGFGKANNEGIKIAKGRNLFLLNTDTYLINNAIYILMSYSDAHPEVGSCGGSLFHTDMQPTYSYHRVPYGIWSYELSEITLGISRRFVKYPFYNTSGKPLSVGNVTGADFMVKRSVINLVGMFDPDFFMYGEESELSWRIRKAGYKNMNVPGAKIVHLEGKSCTISEHKILMGLDGRKKNYIKTRNVTYFHIANILLLIGCCMRILLNFSRNNKNEIAYYKSLMRLIYVSYYK